MAGRHDPMPGPVGPDRRFRAHPSDVEKGPFDEAPEDVSGPRCARPHGGLCLSHASAGLRSRFDAGAGAGAETLRSRFGAGAGAGAGADAGTRRRSPPRRLVSRRRSPPRRLVSRRGLLPGGPSPPTGLCRSPPTGLCRSPQPVYVAPPQPVYPDSDPVPRPIPAGPTPGERYLIPANYAGTAPGEVIRYHGFNYLIGDDGMMTSIR